jgi:hypothetical protein
MQLVPRFLSNAFWQMLEHKLLRDAVHVHAQWGWGGGWGGGWGWGLGGFALGALIGAAVTRPYYGYGYPTYGYSSYGGYSPGYYGGYRVARRVAIHRARWH